MAEISPEVRSYVSDVRRSQRYSFDATVDILVGGARHGAGNLIDMSKDGAAFRCYVPLIVGSKYVLIIHDFGRFEGKVVRAFNCNCFALNFDLTPISKHRLDKILQTKGNKV